MKFIDTVTLVAGFFADEKHHSDAEKIILAIAENKVKNVVFSDYVLDELLTLSRAKKGAEASNKILEEIINSEIKMLKIEPRHLSLAIEIFKSYGKLSFTDCTTVALMMDKSIREIYSFDSGFDSVAKIIRLKEL